MATTSILVIYTGGTIGMVKNHENGALVPFNFERIYEQIPELKTMQYQIDAVSFDPLIDSADIVPERWIEMAQIIDKNYENYDGFVILHGSDTMSYTASALSFILSNLNKPVVITGSQLPLGELRTDGRENFISAIEIAAAKDDETPIVPEVCLFFENKLFRGNRTYKFNAENFKAFVSGNFPLLAETGVYLKFAREHILKPNFKKLKLHTQLDPNVGILKIFPGMQENFIKSILQCKSLRALVLETFGSGNAPTSEWFIKALADAIQGGLLVVNVSQCVTGSVEMGKYETSRRMKDIGVIGAKDMTTSSAVSKLMVILGEESDPNLIRERFLKPWVGEVSED
jgi:L-asparaginase